MKIILLTLLMSILLNSCMNIFHDSSSDINESEGGFQKINCEGTTINFFWEGDAVDYKYRLVVSENPEGKFSELLRSNESAIPHAVFEGFEPFKTYYFKLFEYYEDELKKPSNVLVPVETYIWGNENSIRDAKLITQDKNIILIQKSGNIYKYDKTSLSEMDEAGKVDFSFSTFSNIIIRSNIYYHDGKYYFLTDENLYIVNPDTFKVEAIHGMNYDYALPTVKKIWHIDNNSIFVGGIASTAIYYTGNDAFHKGNIWRVKISDYKFDSTFSMEKSDIPDEYDYLFSDGEFIYTLAYNGLLDKMMIKKRNYYTGVLVETFATGGVYSINVDKEKLYNNDMSDIVRKHYLTTAVIDENFMYIAYISDKDLTTIFKLNLNTGKLDSSFGINGIIDNKLLNSFSKDTLKSYKVYDFLKSEYGKNFEKIIFSYELKTTYKDYLILKAEFNYSATDMYDIKQVWLISINKKTGHPVKAGPFFNNCLVQTNSIIADDEYFYAVPENVCKIKNFMNENK